LRRAAALLFVLSLLIVSGAMVLGYVLTNRIVTPIRSLTDVAADIAGGNLNQSITLNRQDEVGRLAAAFNNMAGQVQTLVNTLEDRVARRTRALQTSAEVARNITGILELEQLLAQVANLIQERFGYYFVQVLLADDEGFLVTRAGSGELGEPMAARGYRVKLGTQTPIGQAGLGRPQIINDVYRSPGWEYNPLLPDTKAELALPLQRRTSTLGVLNVHSNRKDAFSSEDITVLQSIANQLVIAVRNARLFHESEAARRQAEQLLAELDQTSHDLARRSAQLQTAIRVSTAAGTILEPQTLLQEAVNLIKEQFNFYYAGLFLVDEAGDWAVLKAGTGQAGQQQLAENHRLKLDDTSMVGWSITHRQARIAGDVERDTVRFVNPNLPHTRSEMALPLVSHNQVLGAITVQSERENAFSDQDISVLQTVADQIAAALQNSRLFSQVQAIQARFEDLYHRAPAGYHTLAVDGTILEINNTELNLLGRRDERENIVNRRNITDFMTAESTTRFNKALRQLQAGERVDNLELTYVCRDGTTRPVLTTAAPERDNNGRITEIYASVQDISRQKQAEAARRWLVQEMETLYHLGRQLLTAETLPQIYQAGIDAIKTTNPGRGVAVLMYNQAPNKITLELAALWDNPAQTWPPVPAGSTFSAVELGLQEILQTGQTITAAGEAIAATFAQPLCQLLAALQIESLAGTPL
ncbi:MAG: GAF domain-containing protein, partial [Anaerolineae bacterium]